MDSSEKAKKSLGFCHLCKKNGLERPAICQIEKKKYCATHTVDIALDYYARYHLKTTKQANIDDFKQTVLIEFIRLSKWCFDEKFKDDTGIL